MKKQILFYILFELCGFLSSAQSTSVFVYKEVLNSKEIFYHRLICNQSSSLYLTNKSFEKKTILKLESPKSINDTLGDSSEKIKESLYNSNSNLRTLYFDEEGNALYKSFKDSIIVIRQIVNSSESLLIHEPKLPKINWVLVDSNKKIGNYFCQKATTTFRGRDYEAWYTIEIPISNGPWKLHGLPGLIIQAKTTDNKFSYELVNIEKSEMNNIEIKKPIMGRKISLLDLEKETEKINEEHDRKVMLEYAERGINIKVSSKTDNSGRKELNYNDLK